MIPRFFGFVPSFWPLFLASFPQKAPFGLSSFGKSAAGLVAVALFWPSFASAEELELYSAAELKSAFAGLAAKGASYSNKDLARFSNHYFLLIHRSQTGSAELHQHEADIFFVEDGQATILSGGQLVDGKTTKPGELRGSSIAGGKRQAIAKGDVIHIPAGVPHQVLIDKGHSVSYLTVKVSGQ